MVNYDVMIDNEGHYVRMSLQEIIDSGRETVRIRSMRGHYYEIRVEALVQTDREETARRRNAYFAHQRRERREDPDYEPRIRRPRPIILREDEEIPQFGPMPTRRSTRPLIPRIDDNFRFPVDDEVLTVPEPQLRNEEAENWRKLAIKNAEEAEIYRDSLNMAGEEIKDLQDMLKDRDRKIVLGMIKLMELAKQK